MKQFVRVRIDRGVQPLLLVTESDHSLINRNEVRILAIHWL